MCITGTHCATKKAYALESLLIHTYLCTSSFWQEAQFKFADYARLWICARATNALCNFSCYWFSPRHFSIPIFACERFVYTRHILFLKCCSWAGYENSCNWNWWANVRCICEVTRVPCQGWPPSDINSRSTWVWRFCKFATTLMILMFSAT